MTVKSWPTICTSIKANKGHATRQGAIAAKVSMNMAKNKAAENKATNKAAENKAAENKAAENKAAENKAAENNAYELTAEELKAEQLAIALAYAGMAEQIEPALVTLGMATTQAEHEAARPKSAKDIAYAMAADLGLDLHALKPAQAGAATLAVSVEGLSKAFGKYGKHVFAPDTANGTSLVTHSVAKQLLESGKCSLPEVLKTVRQHLPNYASTGHYNTLKRMLKAEGFELNVAQASFSIK